MEDAEEELHFVLLTNILSIAVLESFLILVSKCTVCVRLYVINNEIIRFVLLFSLRQSMFK
jgi:hypothetical protein